jgi:polyhydroxyalkanoate synthesis regulator phasin
MEKTMKILAALLLFVTAPFAYAEHGSAYPAGTGHDGRDSAVASSQQVLMLKATDDQRVAFVKCRETTERVRKLVDQMVGPGTRWRYDSRIFPGQEAQLQSALADMTAAHQQFRQTLSSEQGEGIAKHLSKLEQLQSDLNARIAKLDQELMVAEPDWRRLYNDSHKIKEAADKWRSEHKKIAKELSMSG